MNGKHRAGSYVPGIESQATVGQKAVVKWHDPEGWPRRLRWLLTGPLSLLTAVIAYFGYAIVNLISAESQIPAVAGLLAIGIGSFAFVSCGRLIAPSFNRYVGSTLVVSVLVATGYYVGVIITRGTSETRVFYAALVAVVAASGAVYGALAAGSSLTRRYGGEVYAWMPRLLRWWSASRRRRLGLRDSSLWPAPG